jgi:hypothetical protein
MKKKSQGLSINTIIIAIIAVLVLVVLIAILGGNIRKFTGNTETCATRGGKCGDPGTENCIIPKYVYISGTECDDIQTTDTDDLDTEMQTCCVPIVDIES